MLQDRISAYGRKSILLNNTNQRTTEIEIILQLQILAAITFHEDDIVLLSDISY